MAGFELVLNGLKRQFESELNIHCQQYRKSCRIVGMSEIDDINEKISGKTGLIEVGNVKLGLTENKDIYKK